MMPKCSARKASRAAAPSLVRSRPRISIRPDCGARMPQSRLKNVDLPLPEGPISRMRSRAGSAKSFTASEKPPLPGQENSTSLSRTMSSVWVPAGLARATSIEADLHHAAEVDAGLGAAHLEPALLLGRQDRHVELLGAGEHLEVAEADARDAGRRLALEGVLRPERRVRILRMLAFGIRFGVSCRAMLIVAMIGAAGTVTVAVVCALEREPGRLQDASGRIRQLEERLRRLKLLLGPLDGCLLLRRFGLVLEAHDVGARRLQLHGEP